MTTSLIKKSRNGVNVPPTKFLRREGFTLVEILLVITVIGVMSALVLTAITGASQQTGAVVARQQQVMLQNALHAWINSPANESIAMARANYNAAASHSAKLNLIGAYLAPDTLDHLSDPSYTSGAGVGSDALSKSGQLLHFSDWTEGGFPVVELVSAD